MRRLFMAGASAVAVFSMVATIPAVAQDAAFGSSVIFGAPNQSRLVCLFTNSGRAPIKISNYQVFANDGRLQSIQTNNCSAFLEFDLAPRRTCALTVVNVAGDKAYGCRATVDGKEDLRGSFLILGPDDNVLNETTLR